jgi:hypothetical protein
LFLITAVDVLRGRATCGVADRHGFPLPIRDGRKGKFSGKRKGKDVGSGFIYLWQYFCKHEVSV